MKPKRNSDESEDYAHNTNPIRMKCPVCIRIVKGKNHVKVHKNLVSLWWHFKTEHGEMSNSQFNTDEIIEILKKISKAIHLEMIGFD